MLRILRTELVSKNGIDQVFCHALYDDVAHFGHWLLEDEVSVWLNDPSSISEIMSKYEVKALELHEESLWESLQAVLPEDLYLEDEEEDFL